MCLEYACNHSNLNFFFLESVRKYPTLPFLNRFSTKEYPIGKLGLTIPKGTPVVISLLGLMRDPENFPNPDNFWPDRFSEDNPKFNPAAYLPFGDGPRACIGRFAYCSICDFWIRVFSF